jgi:Concanavalin A-like lectin/glucanases superfamily
MRLSRSKTGFLLAGCYAIYACSSSSHHSTPSSSGAAGAAEGGAAGQTTSESGSSGANEAGQPAAGAAGAAGASGTGSSGDTGVSGMSGISGMAGTSSQPADCTGSPEGSACQAASGAGVCCENGCVAGQCCVTADCSSLGVGYLCTSNQCSNVAGTLAGLLWQLPCTGEGDAVSCPTNPSATVTSALGGSAGVTYDVSLRFHGVVEQKSYIGGCGDGSYWQGEGSENGDSYNVYRLSISSPAQTFFLNVGASNITNTVPILFDKTVRIDAGATVTLYADSKDGTELKNLDSEGSPVFLTGTSVAQPYNGQYIQMDVLSVVPDPVSELTSAGSAGNALSFNGSQVATVLANDLLESNNITTEAWFNFHGPSGSYNTLFGKAYESNTADSYTTWFESGGLHAGINLVSATGSASVAFAATNTWHHVVSTYDYRATQEVLYLDGIAVSCIQMPALINYDGHPLELGGDYDAGALDGFWNGELDELRIFSSVRAADEVWADMHTRKLGITPGLTAEWTFDEGAGQSSADSSGNGMNAILGTSTAVEASDPTWITSTAPY